MGSDNHLSRKLKNLLPARIFTKWQYYKKTGRKLNLNAPKTFNEKIQWLKIYYRDNRIHDLVDKYEVRKYVKEKIGDKYLNDIYAIYNSTKEIDFNNLPSSFVLKGTHGSGMVLICKDKINFNLDEATRYLNKWMKTDWYGYGREWAYKGIQRRIICEKLILDEEKIPYDYKFYCFNGEPKFIQVDLDRFDNHKRDFYDINWNKQSCQLTHPVSNCILSKPENLDEMAGIAFKLACDFPFVRIDLYTINNKIYFGEMTFYPGRGLEIFEPIEYESLLGEYLHISLFR